MTVSPAHLLFTASSYVRAGLTTEARHKNIKLLHTSKPCCCLEVTGTRVPKCRCEVKKVSPLLQVRWLRLVIDEGHVSASFTTDRMDLVTKYLNVEQKW